MPDKSAKTAAKATGSKTTASKVAPKIAAPRAAVTVKPAVKAAVAPAAPKAAVKPPVAAPRVEEPKKVVTQRQGFKANEFVVYPAHGVGQILAIEEQEIAGAKLELFVINFMKDKMTLRVPTAKVANVGMRKLSEPALVKKALETLKGRARVKRTMWSRRAQEYEAKINSGDIVAIAEVVRDLYRSESQPEQSYSERQLYEAALDRLSREIAVVQHSTETEAVKEIESQLAKSPRRGAKTEAGAKAKPKATMSTQTVTTPPWPTKRRKLAYGVKSKARSKDRAFCLYQFYPTPVRTQGPFSPRSFVPKAGVPACVQQPGLGLWVPGRASAFALRATADTSFARDDEGGIGRIAAQMPMPKRIDQPREYRRALMTDRREQRMA